MKARFFGRTKTPQPLIGGVVATAGGLVFTGEGNGAFDAFDAKSGKLLWHFNCGAGVNAPPITYAVDGKQYVAVAAGGSAIWGYPQGDALVVFGVAGLRCGDYWCRRRRDDQAERGLDHRPRRGSDLISRT